MVQSKHFLPEGKNAGTGGEDQSKERLKTTKASNPWLDSSIQGMGQQHWFKQGWAPTHMPAVYSTDTLEASLGVALLIASTSPDTCPQPQPLQHSFHCNLDIALSSRLSLLATHYLASSALDLNPCIHHACKPSTLWMVFQSATRLRTKQAPFTRAARVSEYLHMWLALGKPFPGEPFSSTASQNSLLN